MSLRQILGKFLVWRLCKSLFLPQVGRQISIGFGDCSVRSLSKVAECTGGTSGRSIAVFDTSHLKQLLGNWSRYDAGTPRRWYQAHLYRTAFPSHLAWHRVWLTDLVAPVTTSNRYNGEFCQNDSTSNGSGYLLGAFYSQSDMSIAVPNGDKSLQKILDLAISDQATQLGNRDPFFAVFLSASTATSSASTTTSTSQTSTVTSTRTKTSTKTTTGGWSSVRHLNNSTTFVENIVDKLLHKKNYIIKNHQEYKYTHVGSFLRVESQKNEGNINQSRIVKFSLHAYTLYL
ncbi:hypothetical protein ALC53_09410 [Atta colombica]|uniref:Uncharacterized protein n=1 Tax=Atta colombica TaxID=520822 RepID=A0A195B742_9HYME|nr:hypothetical protein ALC53_09410 [Atta colombica]